MAPVLRARPPRTDRWAPADFRSIRRPSGEAGNGRGSGGSRAATATTASTRHIKRPRSVQPPRTPVEPDHYHGQEARARSRSNMPLRLLGHRVNLARPNPEVQRAFRPFPLPRMSIHGMRSVSSDRSTTDRSPSTGTVRRAARMHASNDPSFILAQSTSNSRAGNPQPSTSTAQSSYRPGPASRRGRKRSSREADHVELSDEDSGSNVGVPERQRPRWYTVQDLTRDSDSNHSDIPQLRQGGNGSNSAGSSSIRTRSATAAERSVPSTSISAGSSGSHGNPMRRGHAPRRVLATRSARAVREEVERGYKSSNQEVIEVEESDEEGPLFGSDSFCTICLNQIEDLTVLLPCLHKFDNKCIGNWFKEHRNCPVCRATISKMRINFRYY